MAKFDIEAAKKAGYTEAEIVDHLAGQSKFDAKQARASGYSDTELLQHLSGSVAEQPPAAPQKLTPENTPGIGQTVMIGAGRTFDRVLDGATQMWLGATGAGDSTKAALKASVDEKTKLYKPLQEARPIATAVGEALPSMVVPVGTSATALGTTAKLAASGAIPAALEYGTAEERMNAGMAGGVGAVVGGQVLPKAMQVMGQGVKNTGAALIGKVSPEVANLYRKAMKLGIPVNAAQLSDSKFVKVLASAVDSMPFTGSTAMRQKQQEQFNRAVSRTFGEDSPKITREVYDAARERMGKEFEKLSNRSEFQVTPEVMTKVNDLLSRTQNYTTPDTERIVTNIAKNFRSRLDVNTMTVPGSVYQDTDTLISRLLKTPQESAPWIGELRDILREGMDKSIRPQDRAAWNNVRKQYKNLKAVRDIIAKDGADGNISPALLMGRLNATQAGKETMARGKRGDLGDIAQVGKQFLIDKIPNSGTAQRALALSVLGGGGLAAGADPQTVAGLMVAGATSGRLVNKVLNSPASGARLMNQVPARTIAEIMKAVPSKTTQVIGAGTGMTIADLYNQ